MASIEQRLAAGLEALEWRETATRGDWRRFGKFGLSGGARYIWKGELWHSPLHIFEPDVKVVGPMLDNVLEAGDKQLAQERPDTQALLIELLYSSKQPNGGSSG